MVRPLSGLAATVHALPKKAGLTWRLLLGAWMVLTVVISPRVWSKDFVVPADRELSSVNLLPHVSYIEDPSRAMTFDEVRALFVALAGKTWPEPLFNAGFSDSRWWFHFVIDNPDPVSRQVFAEIDYPLLDRVDAYCGPPGGRYVLSRLGDHVQFDTRELIVRNHVIPLTLPSQSRRECFIRVESTSNIAFPITLHDMRPFIETSRNSDWRLGAFYGIALALLVYNLLVFVASREKLYLYYALHVFASGCYNSFLDGSLGNLWSTLGLKDYWLMVFIVGSQAAALLFAREYLDYRDPFHPVSRVISGCLFLLLAETLAIPFVDLPVIARVILHTTLIVSLLVLALGLMRWRETPRTAIPFVLGFGAVVSMAIGASLASLGWFSSVVITTYGMKWAWAFELAMLSSGLGLRIEEMKRRQFTRDLDHAETDARTRARQLVLSSLVDTLREPVDTLVDLSRRLTDAPLHGLDRRRLDALYMTGQLVAEHLAHMNPGHEPAEEPETSFDWWLLVGGCAGMFAPRFTLLGMDAVLSVDAGTPRDVIARQGALLHVLHEVMSRTSSVLAGVGMQVRLGLTDDIHDDRLWLKIVIDAPPGSVGHPAVSRGQLSEQGQACLAALDGRVGWSNPESGTGAWLIIPVSVPDDVESAERAWCMDLLGDDETAARTGADSVTVSAPEPGGTDSAVDAATAASVGEGASRGLVPLPSAGVAAAGSDDGLLPSGAGMTPDAPIRDGLRVLLAEDNLINQKVILGFLDRLGADVTTVTNGRQALECFQTTSACFDLVLMDCQMPVMSGFEAIREIRAWETAQGRKPVPAIGLSAHSGEEWRQQGQEAGLDIYLTKPLTFRGVVEAVNRVLALTA